MIRGQAPESLRLKLQDTLETVHLQFAAAFADCTWDAATLEVVLSACRTGGGSGSVAQAIAQGVDGAVVATQLPLRDSSAALFARALYGALGGAIAFGHPNGMSGTRISLFAIQELQRRKRRYAVASLCIGGGQGMAAIFELA